MAAIHSTQNCQNRDAVWFSRCTSLPDAKVRVRAEVARLAMNSLARTSILDSRAADSLSRRFHSEMELSKRQVLRALSCLSSGARLRPGGSSPIIVEGQQVLISRNPAMQ